MRALWSGALSFGLVNIPVRLYSATAGVGLQFDYLHRDDLSPIRYARVCRADGEEVPFEDVVKGYEYQKGDYVVLTEADFKHADVKKRSTIDIIEFVDGEEIDPIYFEKPYYLEPDRGAEKAYALLREALKRSGKVAVATFVLRTRECLGAIKPKGNALVLDQLRFKDEIRTPRGLKLPTAAASEREVGMALKLINQLTAHFDPARFKDTYTDSLREVIAEKAKGKKPRPRGTVPKQTRVPDLMAALKKSLERAVQ